MGVPELGWTTQKVFHLMNLLVNGCKPLFPGESGVDQLAEIIKILGTPTREEIKCMIPHYTHFKFPQIKAHPWHKVCSYGIYKINYLSFLLE
ncbi:putative protein-serine/threonine kinase [Helianthus annuus]|nr:putative protein-serine/threonine kinase [Helianthus annuus]KAJ0542946.1 putative protein-serine/threonine kinase [Helianthus annuus]KAJ0708001.1 putative protein-serine/threonine kinase [Helianthus annuus]KAJ0888914.1 putative protein-serine/threonine kinase [Helianthus annuus]